jgi:hypothetical protein
LEQFNKSPLEFLSRHLRGDWGNLCQEDSTENEIEPEVWIPIVEQPSGQRKREALGDHRSRSIRDDVGFACRILKMLLSSTAAIKLMKIEDRRAINGG